MNAPAQSADPGPAADMDWDREVRLKQYQLENLCRQAARVPVPVILAAGVVAYLSWQPVPGALALTWVVAVALAVMLRGVYARHPIETQWRAIRQRLRNMVLLSMLNGAVAGIGSAYFFLHLPPERQTLLTMIVVGWTAGAVSANAAYARAFFAYTLTLLTPLAIAWATQGPQGMGIAALAMLFLLIEASFVRDNEKVFRQSFSIRYENELLVRRLEQQSGEILREKERAEAANNAKSRFLAAASHDIRQPLHTIGLYSAALSLRKTDDRSKELARQISVAVTSLGSLLDSLLDISKLDAAAVKPEHKLFDFATLGHRLAEELEPVAQAKGLALRARVDEGLYVDTDPLLLERIVRNLLDNAIKYTREGTVSLRAQARQDEVVIEVADTGVGIPPEERERIFEEFYQLSNVERDRAQGLGLGLAIVQRLVRLLGLRVGLESTPGRGSCFSLTLPRAAAPVAVAPAPVATQRADSGAEDGRSILVVEDEQAIREGMQALLESWGYAPRLAWDRESALAQCAQGLPELVIADYRLRDSQTGIEVIRALRAHHGDVPALMVSGDTAPERLQEIQNENILLLHKPVADAALRGAIETTIKGGIGD